MSELAPRRFLSRPAQRIFPTPKRQACKTASIRSSGLLAALFAFLSASARSGGHRRSVGGPRHVSLWRCPYTVYTSSYEDSPEEGDRQAARPRCRGLDQGITTPCPS